MMSWVPGTMVQAPQIMARTWQLLVQAPQMMAQAPPDDGPVTLLMAGAPEWWPEHPTDGWGTPPMARTPQPVDQSTSKWWLGHPINCWLTLPDGQKTLLMAWTPNQWQGHVNPHLGHPISGQGTPINGQDTPTDGWRTSAHGLGYLTDGLRHSKRWSRPPHRPPHPPTHIDLVELAKIHGLEAIDGGADVLAVRAGLHHLQLPHTRHVGQAGLDLRHVGHLRG